MKWMSTLAVLAAATALGGCIMLPPPPPHHMAGCGPEGGPPMPPPPGAMPRGEGRGPAACGAPTAPAMGFDGRRGPWSGDNAPR